MAGVRVTIPEKVARDLIAMLEADAESGYGGEEDDDKIRAWEQLRLRLYDAMRRKTPRK